MTATDVNAHVRRFRSGAAPAGARGAATNAGLHGRWPRRCDGVSFFPCVFGRAALAHAIFALWIGVNMWITFSVMTISLPAVIDFYNR
jgi:hypothetical protein